MPHRKRVRRGEIGHMGENTITNERGEPEDEPCGDLELEAMAPDIGPPPRSNPDETLVLRLSDLEESYAEIGVAGASGEQSSR